MIAVARRPSMREIVELLQSARRTANIRLKHGATPPLFWSRRLVLEEKPARRERLRIRRSRLRSRRAIEIDNAARSLPHPPHGRCARANPFVYWRVVVTGSRCRTARAKEHHCSGSPFFVMSFVVLQSFFLHACTLWHSPAEPKIRAFARQRRQAESRM
jgi:hypothetical protein